MKHLVDLHTHTTASDGQYSPAELVELARDAGLKYVAVTDHDTLRGLSVTAGSDFHGEKVKPDVQLQAVELDVAWLVTGGCGQSAEFAG